MAKTKTSKNGDHTEPVKIAGEALPRRSLEAAIQIARLIRDTYAGKAATWPEIASALHVSPKNDTNRYPVWAALAYGIIRKDENNQYSVTETGRKILAPNYEGENREGILKAILTPSVLSKFYNDYNGSPLPPDEHFLNVLENRYGVPCARTSEARDIIVENARFAGILADEESGRTVVSFSLTGPPPASVAPAVPDVQQDDQEVQSSPDLQRSCFIITPLGADDSIERKHANAILNHLIDPVLREFDILAIRADRISKPGIITKQIVEHLAYCQLCIADLSFNNPNAFYELGVRHTFKMPTIQIIRKGDKIPFDVSQGRTIIIDTSDAYTIMDRLQSARAELKEHVEHCLSGLEKPEDSPIGLFLPGLRVSIPKASS